MKTNKPLPMTDAEILASYKNAANPLKQVKILSELNLVSQERIIEILVKMGVDRRCLPRKKRTPKPTEKVTLSNKEKPVETTKTEPTEKVAFAPAGEIVERVVYFVAEVTARLKDVLAQLAAEIDELTAQAEAKRVELAKIAKLLPALEQCESEVRTV